MPKQTLRARFFDSLWLLLLALYVFAGVESVPFHGDESTVIYTSQDYYYLVDGRMDFLTFSEEPDLLHPQGATQQQLRLLNGSITRNLIGFAAATQGLQAADINNQWIWGLDWAYNLENGHIPSDELLRIGRSVSAALTVLGLIALFVVGRILGGRPLAYVASALLALNPAVLINGRRAMMEGGLICFSILALLAAIWLVQHRHWLLFVVLGLVSGLGLANKHSIVFQLVAIFGLLALIFMREGLSQRLSGRTFRIQFLALVAAGLLSLIVFYTLNPAWWGDPLARAGLVWTERNTLLAGQVGAFGGYPDPIAQALGFFRQTWIVLPMYSETPDFLPYISEAIAQYEASIWRGVSLGGSALGGIIMAGLTGLGAAGLLRDRHHSISLRMLILGWALATFISTWLLTPLEWQRYYLPNYPVVALLAGSGAILLFMRLRQTLSPAQGISPAAEPVQS